MLKEGILKMKIIQLIALAAAVAAVSACNRQAPVIQNFANQAGNEQPSQIYSGSGTVKSITGDQMTIAHGPIPSIGWPAMTMAYTASPDIAKSVKVGAQVDFSFKKSGGGYVLTSVNPR